VIEGIEEDVDFRASLLRVVELAGAAHAPTRRALPVMGTATTIGSFGR
jgi:hypothetical protein